MSIKHHPLFIQPNWPLQDKIVSGTTISPAATVVQGFTLAHHEAVEPARVLANRRRLCECFAEAVVPLWLSQCHGNRVLAAQAYHLGIEADAAYSADANKMPVVLTADCLPILLSDNTGSVVAAVHAGWQGLFKGIIAKTVGAMALNADCLLAWIGPAISQPCYEVDEAFYQRFVAQNLFYSECFVANRAGHYLADLPKIAQWQLEQVGVQRCNIYQSGLCSYSDKRFFSYRRDGQQSGRMATFILPALNK